MRLGYNTNGFAHHRLTDTIEILSEIGYECVALSLDVHSLDPFDDDWSRAAERIARHLRASGMTCVVETGARFLLDPRRKHWPTLISRDPNDRDRRLDFLMRSIDIAAILGADIVSLWSGTKDDDIGDADAMNLLVDGCRRVADHAAARGIMLGFEPEPGMFVDTMAKFDELTNRVNHERFGLTLDLGHVHCLGDGAPADRIREYASRICNIHIEDMRRGVHDHLQFGDGDIAFSPIFAALMTIDYRGPLNVELSRHSHEAVAAARRAMQAIRSYL